MKFSAVYDDFRNRQTENTSILKKLKLTISSSLGLTIGCCVISVVLFYIVICCLGLFCTVCGAIGIVTYLWIKDNTGSSRKVQPPDANFERLRKETENYRRSRDQTLQKLSPLKSENENLQSQLERQTHQIDRLCDELQLMEKEHKSSRMEKIQISDELVMERRRHSIEKQKMESKMEQTEERHRTDIGQYEMALHKKENEKEKIMGRLKTSILEQERLSEQLKVAISVIENERATHSKVKDESEQLFGKLKSELQKYKNMIQEREEQIKQLQTSHTQTNKALEESVQKINEQKVENEHLKLKLENTSKESTVPICNICEDNERNTFLDPCGHTLCRDCTGKVMNRNRKCPVCRKFITRTANLYFS